MSIQRRGSVPTKDGPAANFTGTVHVDSPFETEAPGRVVGAIVSFSPGARTAWHLHPLGQTLVILSGTGWTQVEGGPVEEIRVGDVVSCPPGKRHWHGATATTPVSHVAINEPLDGKAVEWFDYVTDAEYVGPKEDAHGG